METTWETYPQGLSPKQLTVERLESIDDSSQEWRTDAVEGIEYLNQKMGLRLTAYILDAELAAEVQELQDNPNKISPHVAKKVIAVRSVFESLVRDDGPDIARHWFISTQPDLGDEAPAEILKKSSEDEIEGSFCSVWISANHFLGRSDN